MPNAKTRLAQLADMYGEEYMQKFIAGITAIAKENPEATAKEIIARYWASVDANNELAESIKADEAIIEELFKPIRQGEGTNKLTKFRTRKTDKPDILSGNLQITRDNFTVEVEKFLQTAGLRTSTWQLFDALTQEATRDGVKHQKVILSLHDFMNMRGLKNEKEARKQILEDLSTLSHLRIVFNETRKGRKTPNEIRFAIIGTHGIENSKIGAAFDIAFLELYKTYNIMPYPVNLYKADNKLNPNTYYFGRKITEYKNMNYGDSNADIISVESLLNSSPFMPSYEEVANTDRHYKARIIEPFERDMDELGRLGILSWHYCKSKGEPLTDEEAANTDKIDTFIRLLVKVTWHYYPTRELPPKTKTRKRRKKKDDTSIAL